MDGETRSSRLCFTHQYIHFIHDDVIRWKHFPHYWPFMQGIHWSPVNSPHKGQWRRALVFSLIFSLNLRYFSTYGMENIWTNQPSDYIQTFNIYIYNSMCKAWQTFFLYLQPYPAWLHSSNSTRLFLAVSLRLMRWAILLQMLHLGVWADWSVMRIDIGSCCNSFHENDTSFIYFNIKTSFPGMWIPITRKRRYSNCLIFLMGILILARSWHQMRQGWWSTNILG